MAGAGYPPTCERAEGIPDLVATEIEFVVYGKAQPAGSKIAGQTKGGRMFVRDAAKGSRDWKQRVSQAAGECMAGRDLLNGPLALIARFYLPRPKGHFGVNGLRPSAPVYPTTRPDATKLLRALEDGCNGVVWRDDAQVVHQYVFKHYGEPARVEVLVGPMSEEALVRVGEAATVAA